MFREGKEGEERGKGGGREKRGRKVILFGSVWIMLWLYFHEPDAMDFS